MEADIILADYAAKTEGGKFTLVGAGFTNIVTKSFPTLHPSMFLLVRVKATGSDHGRNRINIKLDGEAGTVYKADVDIDVKPELQNEEWIPLPVHLINTKFDKEGDYHFKVTVNGRLVAQQILRLILARPA